MGYKDFLWILRLNTPLLYMDICSPKGLKNRKIVTDIVIH